MKRIVLTLSCVMIANLSAKEVEYTDMCHFPELSEKIQADRPKMEDFVTASPKSELNLFVDQYSEYNKADDVFKEKYKNEIEKVNSEKLILDKNLNASQRRFYYTFAADPSKNSDLLNDVKSRCWSKIMKADEFEADQLCNPIKNIPTSNDWNDILSCTIGRSNLIGLTLRNN